MQSALEIKLSLFYNLCTCILKWKYNCSIRIIISAMRLVILICWLSTHGWYYVPMKNFNLKDELHLGFMWLLKPQGIVLYTIKKFYGKIFAAEIFQTLVSILFKAIHQLNHQKLCTFLKFCKIPFISRIILL